MIGGCVIDASIKDCVRFEGVKDQTMNVLKQVVMVFNHCGITPEITCVTDGSHMEGSYHPQGSAFDIGKNDILQPTWDTLIGVLNILLPDYMDIVDEKDHMHIEIDLTKEEAVRASMMKCSRIERL